MLVRMGCSAALEWKAPDAMVLAVLTQLSCLNIERQRPVDSCMRTALYMLTCTLTHALVTRVRSWVTSCDKPSNSQRTSLQQASSTEPSVRTLHITVQRYSTRYAYCSYTVYVYPEYRYPYKYSVLAIAQPPAPTPACNNCALSLPCSLFSRPSASPVASRVRCARHQHEGKVPLRYTSMYCTSYIFSAPYASITPLSYL